MEVHFKPDVQAKLDQMAREIGCESQDLVEEAVMGYFDELAYIGQMSDHRYDPMQNAMLTPMGGEPLLEGFFSPEFEWSKKSLPQ